MKVAFCGRTDLFKYKGGDAVQMEQTARELEQLGVKVDILTTWDFDYSKYDLIHIFQLDWVSENYLYAINAKRAGKKIVLSPIHHNIKEVKAYDDNFTFGYRKLSGILLHNQFHRDTLKIFYRALKNPEKRIPAGYALAYGLKKLHTKALKLANKVLVQTQLEAQDLKETYKNDFEWIIVPNGVGEVFLQVSQETIKPILDFSDYILCVGRIEARKNQLGVIEAVKTLRKETGQDFKLVFVGQLSLSHKQYTSLFKHELSQNNWITHIEKLDYQDMPAIYKYAKVSVSASWFETTGLTSLESLYCGTNSVASGNRAKELLGNMVSYCEPGSVESIASAISTQLASPRPQISAEFKNQYTWKNAATKTLKVYQDLLND
jgi:glycosyltransferase involved in cell wall biosynthesis